MNDEIKYGLISLISQCNTDEWNEFYDGQETVWKFEDGVIVSARALEYDSAPAWLEAYDEMDESLIDDIDGAALDSEEVADILDERGNLYEFSYTLTFGDKDVVYKFMQFGDGEEASRSIIIDDGMGIDYLGGWIENALSQSWIVKKLE